MVNLIPMLIGFLTSLFKKIGLRIGLGTLIVPLQYAFLGALVVARVSYILLLTTLIVWSYNKLNEILEMITNLESVGVLGMLFSFLRSIGFISALNDSFLTFTFVLITGLTLFIGRMAVNNLKSFSDEYYKIGMLSLTAYK